MKIYLDIFFVINFLMNLLIFIILNIFFRRKLLSRRVIAASALGACFAVVIILWGVKSRLLLYILLYIFGSSLMIRTAYGKTTPRGLVKYMAGYYIAGIFTAGFLLYVKGLAGLRNVPMIFLLIAAILLLFFSKKILSLRNLGTGTENMFPVTIFYRGKHVDATGFLDTGNQLYEPVSHEYVTVVEYRLFQQLLSEEEKADFSKAIHNMEPEMFGKLLLRYIPFHSIGKDNDYLPGVRVDDLVIQINDRKTIHTGKTWLGLHDRFLSADGEYEVLLNSRIFRK